MSRPRALLSLLLTGCIGIVSATVLLAGPRFMTAWKRLQVERASPKDRGNLLYQLQWSSHSWCQSVLREVLESYSPEAVSISASFSAITPLEGEVAITIFNQSTRPIYFVGLDHDLKYWPPACQRLLPGESLHMTRRARVYVPSKGPDHELVIFDSYRDFDNDNSVHYLYACVVFAKRISARELNKAERWVGSISPGIPVHAFVLSPE